MKKVCLNCKKEFEAFMKSQVYCSKQCYNDMKYQLYKNKIELQNQQEMSFLAQFGITEKIISFPIKHRGIEQ